MPRARDDFPELSGHTSVSWVDTLERGIAWWAICVVLSLLGICLIGISGKGSSGPLDVVQVPPFPLLRAMVGFKGATAG